MSNQNLPGPYWQEQRSGAGRRSGSDGPSRAESPWDDARFWRDDNRGAANGRGSAQPRSGRHGGRGPQQSRFSQTAERFSQTADDLRKRFGSGSRIAAAPESGYRGSRRAGDARGDYADFRTGRTAVRDDPEFWTGAAGTRRLPDRVAERAGAGFGGGGRGGRGRGYGGGSYRGRGSPRGGFRERLLYGSWWRHWTLKKALAVMGIGFAGFILLAFAVVAIMYEMTPIPTEASEIADLQSSTVYLANGKVLGTFSEQGQNRVVLTAQQIPQQMKEAIIAAEDRHFYTEGGISVTGILRAGFDDIFGSGGLQGGSTITEQYAKNAYTTIGFSRSPATKIKEIFIAVKLAHEKSKSWILTQYLNTIYFGSYGGNQALGVGAAAEEYFGINLTQKGQASNLTVARAAMLAAMPNEPGFFSPDPSNPGFQGLVERWQYVLGNMVRDNAITKAKATALGAYLPLGSKQAEEAFTKNVKIVPPSATSGETGYKGYMMQMVTQQLEAPKSYGGWGLTQTDLDKGGYQIHTTFSMAKTDALANSINQVRAEVKSINDLGVPNYLWDGAVYEDAKTGAIVAIYGGPGYGAKHCDNKNVDCEFNRAEAPEQVGSSFKPYVISTAVKEGMNVLTSKLDGNSPIFIPYCPLGSCTSQAQLLSNELMKSTTTPPANSNCTQQLPDQQSCSSSATGTWYIRFDEAGEDNPQPLAVNAATAISSDPAYEDLTHRAGVDAIINMAGEFGVGDNPFNEYCPTGGTPLQMAECSDMTAAVVGSHMGMRSLFSTNPNYCSSSKGGFCGSPQITFGTAPLTAVEQASTFATLADDGVYHTPHVVAEVVQNGKALPSPYHTHNVFSANSALNTADAADVDYALSFDNNFQGGTAEGTVTFRPGGLIAKTGTIGQGDNVSQAWFVSAIPNDPGVQTGYALSMALYAVQAGNQSQTLNILPSNGFQPGEDGGAWPAAMANNYWIKEFPSTGPQVTSVFAPGQDPQAFTTWIQATAPPQKKCISFGHGNKFQFCFNCPQGQAKCKNPINPNPNPTNCPPLNPNCTTNGGNGGGGNPASPTTTPSPSPSSTPSPSPSATTGVAAASQAAEDPSTLTVALRGG